MSKMKYIEPNVEVMVVSTKALMGDPLLGSGTGPQPGMAPKHKGDVIE